MVILWWFTCWNLVSGRLFAVSVGLVVWPSGWFWLLWFGGCFFVGVYWLFGWVALGFVLLVGCFACGCFYFAVVDFAWLELVVCFGFD